MSRNHYVNVYYDEFKKFHKTEHVVLPGVLHVNSNDQITFIASKSNITIFIPNADRLFLQVEKNLRFPVNSGEVSETYTVVYNKNEEPLVVPYAVFCENGNDFAEGNSSPKIIVE